VVGVATPTLGATAEATPVLGSTVRAGPPSVGVQNQV
jgi:hypothetical protein